MRTAGRIRNNPAWRRPSKAFPINVRPTGADIAMSRVVARHTEPAPEMVARFLTWGADEKVLLILTAAVWLVSRGRGEALRRAGNHALPLTLAASLVAHGLKTLFDQTRPDRRTVLGHAHGIPFSGKRQDAFPSGHVLHMGALASAAGSPPVKARWVPRTLAIGISAHWASDVIAGCAGLERALRLWTDYPLASFKDDNHAHL